MYYVQNASGRDREKGKYYLSRLAENGMYVFVANKLDWNGLFFDTIKDAQRFVRDWDCLIDVV